ncbi:MAG: YbaB/EbfC family nucleoid-associated protein [Gemmatimonadetes bacterium]|nr:YbaB/EbfC family nucleoid-associated protein [Gemmatimonadota bacterium]
MTNLQQLIQMGQQIQARLTQLQDELGSRTVASSAGGGMVTATADGRGRIREIRIDPGVVDSEDVEMLEDLVLAAVTDAQTRAHGLYEEELKKLTGGFPFPFPIPFSNLL